jgi:ribonuclease P protein component
MQRADRLRSSADFQRVRGLKQSLVHPLLILYTAPNEVGHPRLGVSVSRRIGKAVVRNRVRRRIRESVRLQWNALRGARDLLFIARGPSAEADWEALRRAVDELLRRAGLLSGGTVPAGRV